MVTCVLRRYVAASVLLVPNLSEGTDIARGRLPGDLKKKKKKSP